MEVKVNRQSKIANQRKPEIRYLTDLIPVLFDRGWAKTARNIPLYYIYRGLKTKNGIRYDVTVIPPKMLGEEFVKTKGHYHFGSYGELYKILAGESIFLIQKKEAKDVYFVRAKRGEYILIPPHYGHTIINPSSKTESSSTLKIANWVSKDCRSDYKSIERKRGFCYYYTKSGWVKNKFYKQIPKLKIKRFLKLSPKSLKFLYGSR
jgi:glucose-6-phosphate isomerase